MIAMTEKTIRIEDCLTDAGSEPFPGKSQYVRGGKIFTCPICGAIVSSHTYLHYSSFEDECARHLFTHVKHIQGYFAKAEEQELKCRDCENFSRGVNTKPYCILKFGGIDPEWKFCDKFISEKWIRDIVRNGITIDLPYRSTSTAPEKWDS